MNAALRLHPWELAQAALRERGIHVRRQARERQRVAADTADETPWWQR